MHFFCHLIPALIWQEVLVCGPEVGDLWIIESLERLVKWPVGKTYKNNFGENAGQIPEPFYLYHSQETGASHHTWTKNHMFFFWFLHQQDGCPMSNPSPTYINCTHTQSESVSCSVVLTLYGPTDSGPPGSSVCGILQEEYWSWYPFSSPGDIPNSGIEPGSPTLQVDSLLPEPPGKPINCKPNVINLHLSESKSCIYTLKESEEGLEKLSFCLFSFLFWLIFYIEMIRLTL